VSNSCSTVAGVLDAIQSGCLAPRNSLEGFIKLRATLVLLLALLLPVGLPVLLVDGAPVDPMLKQYLALICGGGDWVSSLESLLLAR
jgi:hypothetical protein